MAKPKRILLSKAAALDRLERMLKLIDRDVSVALEVEAALEEANKIVVADMQGVHFRGASTYGAIHLSGLMHLALVLARLFDWSAQRQLALVQRDRTRRVNPQKHPNRSDIASIPQLVHLLRQRRCRAEMAARARQWTPQIPNLEEANVAACEIAVEAAISKYATLRQTPTGRQAMKSLAEFRNKELAHSLVGDGAAFKPKIRDLFLLVDVARDVLEKARLAIEGNHISLDDREKRLAREARAFWRASFDGIIAASQKD